MARRHGMCLRCNSDLSPPMKKPHPALIKIGRPLLGTGVLCLTLLLGACGGDDGHSTPADPGNPGGDTPPAACTTAHCAPTP